MSIHPSLKTSGKIQARRNVLKRHERIDLLRKEGKWSPDTKKVFGLPKTRGEG
ncbi:MAG: small basic protein [Lentisphaerae bacterium]|nr:MAG: small basic protein [Lentisphaerota bacterium]